jgi:2-dehydropantoate 2-reductase
MTNPTWHVLGPGAIGSLFACHLQRAGYPTYLLSRAEAEDARIITLEENTHASTQAFSIDNRTTPIDWLLVTVKAHQTRNALQSIQHRLHAKSRIILLQNGMGTHEIVEQLFPEATCLVATTTEGAFRACTNHIVHAGRGETWIGALQTQYQPDADKVQQYWQALDLVCHYDPDIMQRLWLKLAINCAINPLTVIYDCKNGALLHKADAMQDMKAICEEVQRVMEATLGAAPNDVFERSKSVAEKTANNVSSMLQDVRKGCVTEIDFITGYLVKQATALDIEVPLNQSILSQLSRHR